MTLRAIPLNLMSLRFRIERQAYPSASGLTGVAVTKIRDDGRVGPTVGDELVLWDALEEARQKLQQVLQSLKDETQARLDVEKERDDLRQKVKGMADRVAAQSELLTERAEKGKGKR